MLSLLNASESCFAWRASRGVASTDTHTHTEGVFVSG